MPTGVVVLFVAPAAAGCGGAKHASGPPAPSLATTCGTPPPGLDAATGWLTARDGVRLYSATAGTGDRVVALDGYLDEEDARRLVRRAGSADKQVAVFPGTAHGWDILDTEPAARRLVLSWITRHSS
ncbi:MAG: hypothetical protein ACXVQQ_04950 [Gaiellaceae bacterium]